MKLYNTFSKKLETFKPHEKKKVTMYVCGITPYDTTHLGHAFTYMAFDVLLRFLRYQKYEVTYVQNVTDIDDDILKRAKKVNQDWKELGDFWTKKFLNDIKALNIQMPTHYVKASETIPTIIEIITALQEKEFAYAVQGNVYFNTKKDTNYGKLSKYSRAEMIKLSKERGADPNDPLKKDQLDFILWQKSLPDEPYWESPWGKGRPGWHIECSAMIYKYLDKYIDIHGGGTDLIYPHHESEIAQSETFTGFQPFVNYWMHTGAVGYKGEKMSKSLGNLVLISDLLKTYSPNAIRYLLLSHHYREPWEYKELQLKIAEEKFAKLKSVVMPGLTRDPGVVGNKKAISNNSKLLDSRLRGNDENRLFKDAIDALEHDLYTPAVLDILDKAFEKKDGKTLKTVGNILGFNF